MMGKPQPQNTVQVIHKIWHVLMEGIAKLNYKNDPYILKTVTDLILKWTPLFKIVS